MFFCFGKRTWQNIENVFRPGGNFHKPGPGSCARVSLHKSEDTEIHHETFLYIYIYIHNIHPFWLTRIKIHAIRRREQCRQKRLHMSELLTRSETQHAV